MIVSCLKEDYKILEIYFNQIKALEGKLKIFLNNVFPAYSENIVLSPRVQDKWTTLSKREYEEIVAGHIGEFHKLISGESPFDIFEEFIQGMSIKNRINDMMVQQKYNLFKL